MRILGLDVGEKRIGVARVDTSVKIAVPVGTVAADDDKWAQLARLSRLYDTTFFVLGLPRSNEGNETAQSLYVRNFAKDLTEKIPGARIKFQDESLTSVEAEKRLKARKKSYEKGEIDAEAATIILQDFIENYHEQSADAPTKPKDTNLIKKSTDKAMLKTKKLKHKLLVIPPIIVILILFAVGGVLLIKKYRAKLRAEEYAKQEAEMVPEVFNFTIVPGDTLMSIRKKLLTAGYANDEITAALDAHYDFAMLADKPANASLEGYLMGETHEFYKSDTVSKIIETFLAGTEQVIEENNLKTAFAARGLSLHEGIILASILQKEAKTPDMPTIAGIIYNRLEIGQKLGIDSTIKYYVDLIDPDRQTYTDNATILRINSCYNTNEAYGNAGLPCGPISNPSLAALTAAANPTDSSYLYFLTGDDGTMYYGSTAAQHEQNRYRYCKVRCNIAL